MRFYRLSDIEIHIVADTDNQFDVIFTKIPHVFGKIVILKTLFLVLVYENNVIRVCILNCPINRPTITNTDIAKMWLIKPIFNY